MNVCVATQNCTYINFHHGGPSDVVKHTGKLVDWSVNAGSTGGQVRLRILRPVSGGKFKAIRSSSLRTITTIGLNKFSASIPVKKGDVLALTNARAGSTWRRRLSATDPLLQLDAEQRRDRHPGPSRVAAAPAAERARQVLGADSTTNGPSPAR
jgi:hypothetical protein